MPPPDPLSSSPALSAPPVGPRSSDAEWLDPRFRKLIGVQMAFGYAFSSLLVVPKFLTTALSATPREIGELSACPALAGIAVAPLCGRWLDRGGARAALLLGAGLLGLSVSTLGFFHAITPFLFASRAVQGIGNTLVIGGTAALVAALVPPRHHARAFGIAGSAALAMNAVASYSTERLADLYGWEVAFEVAGIFALGALLLASSIPRVAAPAAVERVPSSTNAPGAIRGVAFAALAAGAAFATLATFTQPYVISLGGKNVAPLFIGYTATALVVRLGFGGFIDRWGRRRTALASLALYTLTVVAAAAIQPGWLFVLGLGFGAAHGMAWPALNALAVEQAAPGRTGTSLTRLHALFGVGAMGAAWGVGWLVGAIGYPASFAIAAVLVACGTATLRRRGAPRRQTSLSRVE